MENEYIPTPNTETAPVDRKSGLRLPLIALGLDFAPILLIALTSRVAGLQGLLFLLVLLCPVAGLITGIMAFVRGRGSLSLAAKIIAGVAILLPFSFIVLIVLLFVGAATGVISLM